MQPIVADVPPRFLLCAQFQRRVVIDLADLQALIVSVGELTAYLKQLLERDEILSDVMVRGEISNLRRPSSGHIYFSLKDEHAVLNAVCFRGIVSTLGFRPEDGMKIVATGNVTVYEPQGRYQIIARHMQPDGQGDLAIAYEELKSRLEAEGLFAEDRKRPLPRFPRRIALVTSSTGAAVRDMISVLSTRWPLSQLVMIPTIVQGEDAPDAIVRALRAANGAQLDLVILGRGGGSLEDLWAFNDERVARAVFASRIPIISAVGHETDYVLTDFVADARAATPSHAAEMAVPDAEEFSEYLASLGHRLRGHTEMQVQHLSARLAGLVSHPLIQRPQLLVDDAFQRLDDAEVHLVRGGRRVTEAARMRLHRATAQLAGVDLERAAGRSFALRNVFIASLGNRLRKASAHPALMRPELVLNRKRWSMEQAANALERGSRKRLQSSRVRFERAQSRLAGLAPESALRRGYSIVVRESDGCLVSHVNDVTSGDRLAITVLDGRVKADVHSIEPSV